MALFEKKVQPDFVEMISTVLRKTEPDRVHHIEIYLDNDIIEKVGKRFQLLDDLDRSDPWYTLKRDIRVHQFLGYDSFRVNVPGYDFPLDWHQTDKSTSMEGEDLEGRPWVEEHAGPIQTWEDFEKYPWPEIKNLDTRPLEWLDKNLPDGMKVHELTVHVFEQLSWGFGYETLCYKLFDEPDLVQAVTDRIGEIYLEHVKVLCQFDCIGYIWASDDMGFKSQPLLSPDKIRQLILPWHKKAVDISHENGKPYFLHACGNLESFMDDLIDDVGIDAKHSFEDEIMPITEVKQKYGDRVGILGGIDMDFLCRAKPDQIRQRTRKTLEVCLPGGGYCLGTGNSVADYLPLENYLAMMDEGRLFL
jgi:uroporphyrinogen decarboxylase